MGNSQTKNLEIVLGHALNDTNTNTNANANANANQGEQEISNHGKNPLNLTWVPIEEGKQALIHIASGNPSRLSKLNLNRRKLVNLFETIASYQNLKTLQATNNLLSSLPEQLGSLKSLRHLDLSRNQLSSLPDSLSSLTSLVEIRLAHNRFESFPKVLISLRRLESIDLCHNPLTEIPHALGRLSNLVNLKLRHTQISVLPSEISRLQHLRYLSLDGCPLTLTPEVPKERKIPSLKELAARVVQRHSLPYSEAPIPSEVVQYLSTVQTCSFCSGPYFDTCEKRYKITQKGAFQVALEFALCSSHWEEDKGRVLALFQPLPMTAPCTLDKERMTKITQSYQLAKQAQIALNNSNISLSPSSSSSSSSSSKTQLPFTSNQLPSSCPSPSPSFFSFKTIQYPRRRSLASITASIHGQDGGGLLPSTSEEPSSGQEEEEEEEKEEGFQPQSNPFPHSPSTSSGLGNPALFFKKRKASLSQEPNLNANLNPNPKASISPIQSIDATESF